MVLFTVTLVVLGYIIYGSIRPWVVYTLSATTLSLAFVLLVMGERTVAETAASVFFVLNVVGSIYSVLYQNLSRWRKTSSRQ